MLPTSDDATVAENNPTNDDTKVAETNSLPTMPAPEEVQAWSQDTDEIPSRRYGRVITAGLVALVAGMAGAVAWLAATGFDTGPSKSGTPSAIPTTTAAVPSTPVAAPPTVTAPPPASSVAPASPYATLVGKWEGHERELTVSADGTIEMDIPDFPACPTCSMASMPDATIHIGLTSYDATPDGTPDGSGKFFG